MKITGGKFKGQKLYTPPTKEFSIRPLRSRIRKALFDIIGHNLEGWCILDLFAGTGALGIEALSRGANYVIFVDFSPLSLKIIHKNLEKLNLMDNSRILKLRLPEEISKISKHLGENFKGFHLIFITPTYEKGLAEKTLKEIPHSFLQKETLLIVEEKASFPLNVPQEKFEIINSKIYGETKLIFLKPKT